MDNAAGMWQSGPYDVAINGKDYPTSTGIYCTSVENGSTVSWAVAGFDKFSSEIGIADNEPGAMNTTATVWFVNQDGGKLADPVTVHIGHPKYVSFMLYGAVRLTLSCQVKPTFHDTGRIIEYFTSLGDPKLYY